MSSTYAHYQGPASLPQDYAILSRFAGHPERNDDVPDSDSSTVHSDNNDDDDDDDASANYLTDTLRPPSRAAEVHRRHSFNSRTTNHSRRQGFPATAYRPPNPTIGSYPRTDSVTMTLGQNGLAVSEATPLLAPPVPRIEEEIDKDPAADNESMVKMFWEELPILTKYALPVFGTHLLEYTLVIVSVISIGHISTTALAAISLGSMTASVSGFSVIQGFTSALDTMLPSAWTSPQPRLVGLWAQRMAVVMTFCLIPMFFIWFNAEPILIFLKQEPEVAHLAAVYLRWVSLGLPAYAFNSISRRYFQSQGLFAVPTRIIFIIAPLNALLNYLLVWGPEPIRLGFIGAPIATAISFNLIAIFSLLYGIFYVPRTAWHPLSRRMFTSLGVLVQLGLSGVGQVASEWWAWELIALAASLLGPVVLATQSVLLVSSSTTFQAPFALSVATSVRIGNLLGEQKAKRAGAAANTSIVMAFAIAAITSAMFMMFRNSWGYLFNDDPEVVRLVADILPLVALFQVFDSTAGVVAGIFRARGKQFTGALLNLSAYYIFGIPLGIYFAFTLKLGLRGLWYGLTLSLIYCAVIGTTLCLRTDWDREVEKVMDRLKKEESARHAEMCAEEERLLQ